MASLPNPVSFQGVFTGALVLSSQFPRPGIPPQRSMAGSLNDPKKDDQRAGPGPKRSFAAALPTKISRMEIHNLARLEDDPTPDMPLYLQAHFNPTQMKESIRVVWGEKVIPGLSHTRLQYSHTENVGYQFDLFFDALQVIQPTATGKGGLRSVDGHDGVAFARKFLQSLCFPTGGQSVRDGAPPRVLFYWPNFLTMTCVVGQQDWTYSKFAASGEPLQMTCSMQLKEIRDTRLLSAEVLKDGSRRSSVRALEEEITVRTKS
jgi:hypothetical protein